MTLVVLARHTPVLTGHHRRHRRSAPPPASVNTRLRLNMVDDRQKTDRVCADRSVLCVIPGHEADYLGCLPVRNAVRVRFALHLITA